MKPATRQMLELVLKGDDTVSDEMTAAIVAILEYGVPTHEAAELALLTMSAAARKLKMSRTWFWEKVCRERGSKNETFPAVEVSPGVFRYRLRDLMAFVDRRAVYSPGVREQQKLSAKTKIPKDSHVIGN